MKEGDSYPNATRTIQEEMKPDYTPFSLFMALAAQNMYLSAIPLALAGLLFWRLYRFTIVPCFYPNEPKEYPYWIPFVGHLHSFFKNSYQLLEESRTYFKNTRVPYALTVAGQKWYIITSPSDVTSIYKINDGTCSYDIFVEEVMKIVGITKDGIKKAYQTRGVHGEKESKHLVRLCKEYQITQLSPGAKFDELVNPAVEYISTRLDFNALAQRYDSSDSRQSDAITISLYEFVSEVFIGLGQEAYFGKLLGEIEPDLTSSFMTFDALAWQVLYQYPSFLCGTMLAAKSKIHAALEKYFSTPIEDRKDAAWMILKLERDMRRLDVSSYDKALFFFQLYWSICGNNKKGPFWMLSYMLFDAPLLKHIRKEIAPAVSSDKIDTGYLLNSCPLLNAVWDETLHKTSFAASVRFITKDIKLPNTSLILRKGNRIMMPQRQLHFDEQIFGADATTFNAERFIRNPKIKGSGSYRPFGGGTTLCPGRYLAKVTSLATIAALVGRFNISLEDKNQSFPVAMEENPSITLVDVRPGTDLRVVVERRA